MVDRRAGGVDLVRSIRGCARDDAQPASGGARSVGSPARRRRGFRSTVHSRSSRCSSLLGRAGAVENHYRRAPVVLAALLAWLGLVKFAYPGLGSAVLLVTAWLLVSRRRVGPALCPICCLVVWSGSLPANRLARYPSTSPMVFLLPPATRPRCRCGRTRPWLCSGLFWVGHGLLVLWLERGAGRLPGHRARLWPDALRDVQGRLRRAGGQLAYAVGLLGIAVLAIVGGPVRGGWVDALAKDADNGSGNARRRGSGNLGVAPVPGPVSAHVATLVRSADDTLLFLVHSRQGWRLRARRRRLGARRDSH